MKTVTIHQPECLPWLGFLDKARQADEFVLLDCVQYRKNYFQNRNKIRTRDGWAWLTIPVTATSRTLIRDVQIADDGRWRRKHLCQWKDAYRAAPYAQAYLPFLEQLYDKPQRWLVEFNNEVICWIFKQFEVRADVRFASELQHSGEGSELVLSLCQAAQASTYLSGASGKDYLEEREFRGAGIAVRYHEFRHPSYTQRFEPFLPGLSGLDLLLNHGPDAARFLRTEPAYVGEPCAA